MRVVVPFSYPRGKRLLQRLKRCLPDNVTFLKKERSTVVCTPSFDPRERSGSKACFDARLESTMGYQRGEGLFLTDAKDNFEQRVKNER